MFYRSFAVRTHFFSALLLILMCIKSISGQSSSFTYQGRLIDGGTAANGNYDLQFTLWDSLSGGTQIGSTQTLNTVAVSNGVFTVSLDFGAGSFPGANRFLEISARPSGGGSFTLLTPRQQVTSTPYAVRSVSAGNADSAATATNATQLGGVAASQYVQTNDSRLSDARPPTPGSANYIQNTGGAQAANFNISGNGTAGGTLSENVVNATTHYNLSGNRVLGISGAGNSANSNTMAGVGAGVATTPNSNGAGNFNSFFGFKAGNVNTTGSDNSFFGTNAGLSNTSGISNTFFGASAGIATTQGSSNSFFGASAGGDNITGQNNSCFGWDACHFLTGSYNTFIGTGADVEAAGNLINATAIGALATVSQSNSLILGTNGFQVISSSGTFTAGPTNVGIGTTAPQARLHVAGDVRVDGNITLFSLGTASSTQATLCRNTSSQIAFCNSSSLRYKNNVTTFQGGLNIVNRLRPISFTWKQDGTKDIGFGAEEVEKVAPLFTFRNDKGEIEGVRYDRLGVVFVNAFKEQQSLIEKQQASIENQQAEIAALSARLRSIERALKTKPNGRRR